ncbi:hypothetical protein A3F37_04325 [Candidatus Saccharibacteria bacterium RIFCSPHIGHO2_12_FULL_41_12]|nr:MAG: hypothetical protein A3F37_04325 [Candidatus Saccharibacteria bacterium RIFCSPHIGHO2_12_FULL_41_12]
MTGSDESQITYKNSGVDYGGVDPAKVFAQDIAATTASELEKFDMKEITASRGESAYVWEEQDSYRALVIEGLGTKNLVADVMRATTGKTHYDQIAQDAIAMIVNDLIVVGALPNVVNAYFAIGDAKWMEDKERANDLLRGWANACRISGATWGGGETPPLKDIVDPATIDIAGSAVGIIADKTNLVLGDKLAEGDRIILIESSGIHSNGLTMTRKIAEGLQDGFATKMPDGRMFGEALLTPTYIYVDLVRKLQEEKIEIHYMVNITGHGWRKLMRADRDDLAYIIEQVPEYYTEFDFIKKQANASTEEMYGNFNMGVGFAIYVPEKYAEQVVEIAKSVNLKAWDAGHVVADDKAVRIKPLDIEFKSDTLGVRG